jgi:hypothetical protein
VTRVVGVFVDFRARHTGAGVASAATSAYWKPMRATFRPTMVRSWQHWLRALRGEPDF